MTSTPPRGAGLPNPVDPGGRIRAVLFDLDGTLYRQGPVRALMALEFMAASVLRPRAAVSTWRAVAAFRDAQERLRATRGTGAVRAAQLAAAAEASGLPEARVERLLDDWMLRRPLPYLRWARARGIDRLLDLLRNVGVPAGVLSDYPAHDKLRAIGLAGRFAPVLCTTDPDIDALKPDPRGFLVACEAWRLEPREVLMVGDRQDVDAVGAAAAGLPCVIVGAPRTASARAPGCRELPTLEHLTTALFPED